MKRLLLTTSLAALLLSSAAAMAHDHDQDEPGHYDDRKAYNDGRNEDQGKPPHGKRPPPGHIKEGYRRGMRAPVAYLQPRYYVNDYRRYRLAPPPRGYRWVRPADGRYLLVEITSGLISQALGY